MVEETATDLKAVVCQGKVPPSMRRTNTMSESPASSGENSSFADFGKELWTYLTGRGAAINYEFVDMQVGVPRSTGADAPRAIWSLTGTLGITTAEDASRG
jgi:hypothetical protein